MQINTKILSTAVCTYSRDQQGDSSLPKHQALIS